MSRGAALLIHVIALVSIIAAISTVAVRDAHAAEIFTAAILGFAAGVLFDRWILRHLVDWTVARTRSPRAHAR